VPIVICRACKSYAGKAIDYVTDKEKAERIRTHGLDENRSLARQFIETAALHGKGAEYDERKYYHIKISFEAKDLIESGGKLDAALAEKIADEYFREQYGKHEYILATHTDKKHIHCHAIINAVSFESGKKIQHSNKALADMKDAVNDVAERHGVSKFDWRGAVKVKRQKAKEERASVSKELTQAEKYIQERRGSDWTSSSWKETLREKIDEAKSQCTSRTEFEKYLQENYDIEMPRNTKKTVSFKHPAVAETVRGVKLGAEYTAESIDQILIENYERNKNNGRLRHTEERTTGTPISRAGADAGANNEIVVGNNISAYERIRSRADESGERRTEKDIGELYGKLQEIRGLDAQFNPTAQRGAAEADKRAAQSSRAETERADAEQRATEQSNRKRSRGHDR